MMRMKMMMMMMMMIMVTILHDVDDHADDSNTQNDHKQLFFS